MDQEQTINELVNALRAVPTKKLRILELANEIPLNNGAFDPYILDMKQKEIHLAIEEAKIYGSQTIEAVSALVTMRGVD
jgi:Tfp pilus assembly pilus retraction ATPase PilT